MRWRRSTMLFSTAAFLGSVLMFTVEPMVAKMVLPMLGGTPMVWNTCVMFFQAMLLLGYAAAHGGFSVLGYRRYTAAHLMLFVVSLAALPTAVPSVLAAPPIDHPVRWLLLVLGLSVGPPFLTLSATTPAIQRWFVRARPGDDPYFLYAASNLGSLVGLASYPFLIEPTLGLRTQTRVWAVGFLIFAFLAARCGLLTWRLPAEPKPEPVVAASATLPISWPLRLRWIALAFIPSSLLLAVTTYLSTDIASMPLLWVVPLGLYLMTFVVAFGGAHTRWRSIADDRMPLVIVALVVFIAFGVGGPVWLVVTLHLLGLFLAGLLCHCELAERRPPPAQLTEFFFFVALGGMLGGVFNTLIAPVLFTGITEYPLVLLLACLIRRGKAENLTQSDARRFRRAVIVPAAVSVATALLLWAAARAGTSATVAMYIAALLCFTQRKRPWGFVATTALMLIVTSWVVLPNWYGKLVHAERTFFGVYRVSVDERGAYRSLYHGTTLHGMQATDPSRRAEPLTYYHRTGPIGEVFAMVPPAAGAEIAAVGLGVGTLASYRQDGQRWTFYEIDPAVERIARNPDYFTYLRDCAEHCTVVIGDARRSLQMARPDEYGLIILDAFSSDAIPIHLLTREALAVYLSRLAPGGILAFHISNRHFVLGPVLGRLAAASGLTALEEMDSVVSEVLANGKTRSNWLVMARDPRDLGALMTNPRWKTPTVTSRSPMWSDDFSNILSVFNLR